MLSVASPPPRFLLAARIAGVAARVGFEIVSYGSEYHRLEDAVTASWLSRRMAGGRAGIGWSCWIAEAADQPRTHRRTRCDASSRLFSAASMWSSSRRSEQVGRAACAADEAQDCHFPPFVSLAVTSDAAFQHRRKRKQGKDQIRKSLPCLMVETRGFEPPTSRVRF